MDIDFYKGFDLYESVSYNNNLWKELLAIDYLDKVQEEEELIPEGHDGEGETLERVHMQADRNQFIKGLARMLIKHSDASRDDNSIAAIHTIIKTIALVNDKEITHFKLDV